jgi:hypothetical protein
VARLAHGWRLGVVLAAALAVLAADGWWLIRTRQAAEQTPSRVVKEAASQTAGLPWAKATFTTQVGGLTTMFGRVGEQLRPHRATLTMTSVDGSDRFSVAELVTDSDVYLSTPALTEAVGKPWLGVPLTSLTADPAMAGLYQTNALPSSAAALLGAAGRVTKTWTATVDGVPTTRYVASVDAATAARKLSPRERRLLAQVLTGASGEISLVVWIDSQHEIRKFRSTVMTGGQPVVTTIVFASDNHAVNITVPSASQVGDIAS